MMSVPSYHESHPPTSSTSTSPVTAATPTNNAPVNASPSYPFARPAAPQAPTTHDGHSPSSQNGLGPGARLGQAPVYSPGPASALPTGPDGHGLVNTGQHHHQMHSHHAQIPHHQHIVTPPTQYSSIGGHGTSASPPGTQAITPAASSVSPPQKKNTRIPRACDLCSQRKVKVSN